MGHHQRHDRHRPHRAASKPAATLTQVTGPGPVSPAGLWPGNVPLYQRATRWLSRHAAGALSRLVGYRLGRALVLGQTHGRPFRVSPGYARTAIRAMGTCPGFDATMEASAAGYRSGPPIDAPVTVAFGSRDHLLVRRSRRLGELPPATRLAALPRCGHVPMADDPPAVAALIFDTASAGSAVPVSQRP